VGRLRVEKYIPLIPSTIICLLLIYATYKFIKDDGGLSE